MAAPRVEPHQKGWAQHLVFIHLWSTGRCCLQSTASSVHISMVVWSLLSSINTKARFHCDAGELTRPATIFLILVRNFYNYLHSASLQRSDGIFNIMFFMILICLFFILSSPSLLVCCWTMSDGSRPRYPPSFRTSSTPLLTAESHYPIANPQVQLDPRFHYHPPVSPPWFS